MENVQSNGDQFRVLASERSQSGLRIRKGPIALTEQERNHSMNKSAKNPQRSAELKRGSEKNLETIKSENSRRKRVNLDQPKLNILKKEVQIDGKQVLRILKEEEDNFFCHQQPTKPAQTNNHYNDNKDQSQIVFPDPTIPRPKQTSNELLSRTIEIMSNKNQKITIPIHEGLYKSNTSHKNQYLDGNWDCIPNLCNFQTKNQYSDSIEFMRQYKSGYFPIEMQKRNHQEVYDEKKELQQSPVKGKDKTRSHFIRKKQSTLTLPRTCGVSYIKPSQSLLTQKIPFEPLPPLIFQGSTSCAIGANEQTQIQQIDSHKKQIIDQFNCGLENAWLPFIFSDEDEMRDLLLGKKTQNAKVGFVQGIQNLWPLYAEGAFILILISPKKMLTEPEVWQVFENKQTYFKIGILSKKSTSGKKAFLKSIKAETNCNTSVASLETEQNEFKDDLNRGIKIKKADQKTEGKIIEKLRESSSEERKISNTFEMLQQELKDNRTVITMSLRLEMYVEQMDWKENFTKQSKEVLNQMITSLKDKLEKKSIRVICERFELGGETKLSPFEQKFDFLRLGKCQGKQINSISQKKKPIVSKDMNIWQKKSGNLELSESCKAIIFSNSSICSPKDFLSRISTQEMWKKSLKFPIYYISTRDSFAFDLIEKRTILKRSNGREYTRIDYYFYPDNVPTNFGSEYRKLFPQLDVGATAYHGFYTEEEMKEFEDHTFALQQKAFKNKFLQMTVQPSIVSTKIKRTKFFFGYRYMWTRCQLSEPCSYVGAGVRKDVENPPVWTNKISEEMVKQKIVEKDFINSIAINVYHDGKEGLAQHFDDAVRFKQPIYTLRLFSDARLSFGSQFYGFCNGAFIIPLPRGCILVMEENSYAANGVKHCVRPCDMTGKSAAIILRQMHSQVVSEASKYDELIDFPAWLSCLSEDGNSISFAEQKRLEAEQIMKVKGE